MQWKRVQNLFLKYVDKIKEFDCLRRIHTIEVFFETLE